MSLAAQQSREVFCEECEQMVQMTDSTISRMGYGCAPTQADADSMAMSYARRELVELLRDSVVCRNTYQDKDGKYHSCCVLVAKREELSRGSDITMFEILQRMFMVF